MNARRVVCIVCLLAACGLVAWPAGRGQVSPRPSRDALARRVQPPRAGHDGPGAPPPDNVFASSARRGADWLLRAQRPDGHFRYGYVPALNQPLEGDHLLRQVGAAFALARAARLTGDEAQAAAARHAVKTLLRETAPDAASLSPSSALPNRLGAAGMLVMAVNELPSPGEEMLGRSERLCAYVRGQQRPDGSLNYAGAEEPEGLNYYPGEALYGLLRSQEHRPAAWKAAVARKALAHYRAWWRAHKNMAFVPWQAAANAEAYLRTGERPFADFVCEMADWLCELQYTTPDPRHPLWLGGFPSWGDGKPAAVAPHVASASYAEALAEAARVARTAGDLPRHRRYVEALERCLHFLTTLQYDEDNTTHFADWYRPALLGGFHASHDDGNLRIDYTQHAVCALVQYLAEVDRP